MAGIIQDQMGRDALSPKGVMAKMHLQPNQKPQLERIIAAGMKVMFSPETHKMMIEQMNGQGPVEQRLGMGIVALLSILWQESKGALPPQLLIPAGMVLLAHAADFMTKSGQQVTPEQQGAAHEIMIDTLLSQAKIDPAKLAANAERGAQAPGQAPEQAPGQAPMAPPTGAPI